MTIGWGIIGPGAVADRWMAPAIARDPNSELVAVVSRDSGRAAAFAGKHGARACGTDYAEMLANPDVDAVLVTTPNAQHVEQVIAAAQAGKHVLCDKPLGTSAEEAARAVDACRAAGVKLGLNFQTRHHACFQEAKRVVDAGEIGAPVSAQIDASPGARPPAGWRMNPDLAGMGSVNNIAVHIYDVLRYLIGAEATEVAALFDIGREPGIEVLPMVLIRFENGALAFANGNQATFSPLNDFVLNGSRGRISGRGITRPDMEGDMTILTESAERTAHYSSSDCYDRTVAAFSRAVEAGEEPTPSGLDGLRSVQLTDAIRESAREGRTVAVAR